MSERYLAIKVVMMPRDLNPAQTIFGGVLLSYIDQAAAIGARHEINLLGSACDLIVTVAMNKIEFHKPVLVGDVVSFRTRPVRLGRTSITMHVAVEAERGGQALDVTEAEVTMVSVVKQPDGTLKPTPIRRE
ncbi:MAG TPA: hotdog domain-containing protein [Gemmatales bacterium]|nr:hotdog domain-containing protein [Gemmatales bacterium]